MVEQLISYRLYVAQPPTKKEEGTSGAKDTANEEQATAETSGAKDTANEEQATAETPVLGSG